MGTDSDPIRITAPSRPLVPFIRLPAPWYLIVLLVAGDLLYRASKAKAQSALMDDTIANLGVSDRPLNWGDDDAMGFHAMARGISLFLRNANTGLPLVLAINGAWGSGKSSLMNLICANMETSTSMVWFNAWHHQSEEQMLAALLQAVRVQSLEALWSRRGITRRFQLLLAQLGKNWPITTLLSFVGIVLLMLIFHIVDKLISDTRDAAHLTTQIKLWAALISSCVAFVGTLKKLKTSVGSLIANPASLLASYSGSVTMEDLSAQTTFRQRFSNDFKKLINVLGDRRLVIVVDDLDRCRPEKIREILEAVNFLVTSGECAIILGLARPYVEHFLGVAFKDFVEGIPPELLGLDRESDWTAAQLDRSYAGLYLEKLIQIDITIPKPTDVQAGDIIVPRSQIAMPTLEDWIRTRILERKAREVSLRSFFRILEKWMGPILGTVFLVSIFSYTIAIWRSPIYERIDRAFSTPEIKADTSRVSTTLGGIKVQLAPKSLVLSDSQNEQEHLPSSAETTTPLTNSNRFKVFSSSRDVSEKADVPTPMRLVVTPATLSTPSDRYVMLPSPGSTGLIVAGIAALLLSVLPLLLRILLTMDESLTVSDSAAFQEALISWIPLIHGIFHSPRSLKRYMNKVRFLAMRQRGLTEMDPMPALDRLASRIARLLYPRLKGEPDIDAVGTLVASDVIPDDILIVLVAIQGDETLWEMLKTENRLREEELSRSSALTHLRSGARTMIISLREVWPQLREHLPKYVELAGGVVAN